MNNIKIFTENNAIRNNKNELTKLGRKAFIVTGKSSAKKCGALDDIIDALESDGCEYIVFNEIEENPSVETIMKGSQIGREGKCDFVVGIGGGSPLDAAKAIAFVMGQPADSEAQILYDASIDNKSLPVACVPTTCGTGSEVTGVSVLTRHDIKTKQSIPHKICPSVSFVDGKYLKVAPIKMVANTAVDALSHMWESYINTKATEESRKLVDEGLDIWRHCIPILLGEKNPNEDDLLNMMKASTIAGRAIAITGTSLPHALSYPVTYELGIPHGKACGYFLGGYIKAADEPDKSHLIEASGFTDIEHYNDVYTSVCGQIDIPLDLKNEMIENLLNATDRLSRCPYSVNKEVLESLFLDF